MEKILVHQEKIDKLLKYRDETKARLNWLKGDTVVKDMLQIEINTIELALITLGIEFPKE